jgi:UDP-glucose 4-epimerase
MRAIVTGGAGFIGSHVAGQLLERGASVLVVDDLSGGTIDNIPGGADFEQRSTNEDLTRLFDRYRPSAVYHLAAYAAEGLSHHIATFNYHNNLTGTANVLNAAYLAGSRHFVFTSSIAVYGHPEAGGGAFTEADICHPADPYGVAKLACENHIRTFRDYYGGPDYTIFRPHNVFGPRQNVSDPFRNVVGIFFARMLAGRPVPIFGDGEQTRCFSYVDTVARCIAGAPGVPAAKNEIFNVGGETPASINQLAAAVAATLGLAAHIHRLEPRKEVKHAHASHDKLWSVFNERDDIGLMEGLSRMAEYVISHPIPAPTPCPSAIEIADNLPASWKQYLLVPVEA